MTSVEMEKKCIRKIHFTMISAKKKNGFRYWQMSPCENIHSVWIKEKRKKISAWPLLARDGTAYGVYLCAIAIEHVWTMLRPSNWWEFNCPMNRCSINSLFAVFHLNKKESTHFGEYTSRMHSHERWTHLNCQRFFLVLYCSIIYICNNSAIFNQKCFDF